MCSFMSALHRYLQRREWALTAVRLAWLLHFAGAATSQDDTSPVSAPGSLADVAGLAHLACADVLLVLSLLFPVRIPPTPCFLGDTSTAAAQFVWKGVLGES